MIEQKDITLLKVQKELKPKIEDIIPKYLDCDEKATALKFTAYMQENKMPFRWAGVHNAWRALYKGKAICYIRFPRGENDTERGNGKWVINPHLYNLNSYSDIIMREGLQDFVWNNVFHYMFCRAPCHGYAPGKDMMIVGKEIKSICHGREPIWIYDPDGTGIEALKRMVQLEQHARVAQHP